MKSLLKRFEIAVKAALVAFGLAQSPAFSAATDLNDIPMAVSNQVKANFLVILDNSQSMDAYMGGALQAGSDPGTRSNIGREVLRDMLDDYRTSFNWGLMSFDTKAPELRNTYVYYMGDDSGMVFTNDCVNGISASNGNRRCVANPQGGNFVTYDLSSDDPSILDAFYTDPTLKVNAFWGFSPLASPAGSIVYELWFNHSAGSGNNWAASEFSNHWFVGRFSATDSGFLASYPAVSRKFFLPRGWGYLAGITGGGFLNEAVMSDSAAHYGDLIKYLAPETDVGTVEIKNAAIYTPLAGTLKSARDYFSGETDWKSKIQNKSPIEAFCQKNFIMLLTDGLPTGNSAGGLYDATERSDTCSAWSGSSTSSMSCTGNWSFGTAANDAFNAVSALYKVPYTGCRKCSSFDINTYIIAMGDGVANERAVAVMNRMAELGQGQGSGGKAFFANDRASLTYSMDSVLINAMSTIGAAAAVAVTSANVTASTASFQSSYDSGSWTGDLKSYNIDVTTGAPKTGSAANWSARDQLDALSVGSRKIVSYDGARGIAFQPTGTVTSPGGAKIDLIDLVDAKDGTGIVNFIRGDRSGEGTKYRTRIHLLGDIVNSEPVFVAAPVANFIETIDPGYSLFKANHQSRQPLVFQGANDGLLHVFNAASGAEEWAYVPGLLLPTLARLSRTLVQGFTHRYYVDGTPTVGDVDFIRTGGVASTASSNNWRTILVGGLGKGGRGYYALDITDGVPATEAAAAANVLWEFPNSSTTAQVVANLGYSFGKPIIAKAGDRGWVVLVTSGYNNMDTVNGVTGDGLGHLFVLNAKTGELISDIPTGVKATSSPSGLAAFSGYLDNAAVDNTVTQVYAGDLEGNVWRFDLTGQSTGWKVSKLATLVDDSGKPQPLTTAPELALIREQNASYRFVYVGTGKYLADSDVATNAKQSMYGLVDDLSANPTIDPLRSQLQEQTLTSSGNQRSATSTKFELSGSSRKKGWYIDLPASGERVSTDPQLALGRLIFTSNIPSSLLCDPGGSSYLNFLDYRTGGGLAPVAGVTQLSSLFLGDALASRPVLVQLSNGLVGVVVRLSNDTNFTGSVPPPVSIVRRVSWRELPDRSK
jgi:type IV pilus assembly protein PilY1